MTFLSARRLVPTGILAVAAVGALVAPGAASAASKVGTQCSGSAIGGQGSSLQALAQGVWGPGFNSSTAKHACNGTQGDKKTPAILAYGSVGSGAGLKSWGVRKEGVAEHKYEATNAFVGTDEAPNPSQKAEIEENETKLVSSDLATIPVLQAAVAVIVHLPAGCTEGTSTSNKGRIVLNNSTLEGIWKGEITKWSQIKDGGDAFKCATKADEEAEIKHVVRLDGSGTTHIFKKYLGLIDASTAFPVTNVKGEATGSKTWDEIAEGKENASWPTADAVLRPAKSGNPEVVALVAATPGSIGYANLADARQNKEFVPPLGGVKKTMFWTPIQNGETTYADPASNKESATLAESNCAKEEYTNGVKNFPPETVTESWSAITTRTTEPHYTICGLTFDEAFVEYGAFPGTNEEEATTVNNYMQFVVEATGGQKLIKKHDYEPLVGTVLKEAQKGTALLGL